jgi:hypothetical protein
LKFVAKLFLILIFLFAGIIGFSVYVIFGVPNKAISEITESNAGGIIYKIKGTQSCFFKVGIKQLSDTIELPVMSCCGSEQNEFFKFVAIGDSLVKEKGKFTLRVIKAKTKEVNEFPYPYCFQ